MPEGPRAAAPTALSVALTPAQAADAADELWGRILDAALSVAPAQWTDPTPCAGWDVGDLIAHIGGVTTMFAGLPQVDVDEGWSPPEGTGPLDTAMERGVAARRSWTAEQRLEELRVARAAHVEGLRALEDLSGPVQGPTGPTTHRGLFSVRMFDLWHHLGDLSVALGGTIPWDDGSTAARECHAYVAGLIPWLYGKRGGAPDGGSVRVVLDHPLGLDATVSVVDGRARWTAPEDGGPAGSEAPAGALRGHPAWFSVLISGRTSTRHAIEVGGLHVEGPEGDRLASTRMFTTSDPR